MFRVTLRHRDDGQILITKVKAASASQARKALKNHMRLYIINTVERV